MQFAFSLVGSWFCTVSDRTVDALFRSPYALVFVPGFQSLHAVPLCPIISRGSAFVSCYLDFMASYAKFQLSFCRSRYKFTLLLCITV